MSRRKIIPQRFFIAEGPALGPLLRVISKLPAGTGVIFRCYGIHERAAWAEVLARLARRQRCPFLVALDAGLARRVKADGVHLPEWAARDGIRTYGILTVSAHSRRAAARAAAIGADAILLSPLYPTPSHPGEGSLGPHRFSRIARALDRPVIALGGLTRESARHARAFGASGAAGISMFKPD